MPVLTITPINPQTCSTYTLKQEQVTITQQTKLYIGNDIGSNQLKINDPRISTVHCLISFSNGEYMIQDLSTNGVYLNEAKIGKNNEVLLKNGDLIDLINPQQYNKLTLKFTIDPCDQDNKQSEQIDFLLDELQCIICNEVMYQPVSVHPCGHHYCGHCLSDWTKRQKQECPLCNEVIVSVAKSPLVQTIVDKYLKVNPSLTNSMSKSKTNNQVDPNKQNLTSKSKSQSKQDGDIQQNYQIKQQSQKPQALQPPGLQPYTQWPRQTIKLKLRTKYVIQQRNIAIAYEFPNIVDFKYQNYQQEQPINSCKTCEGQVWKNFTCSLLQPHLGCTKCGQKLPKRELTELENEKLKLHCQICKAYYCQYVYNKANEGLLSFKDFQPKAHSEYVGTRINLQDQERIRLWLEGRQVESILRFMIINYIDKHLFVYNHDKRYIRNPIYQFNITLSLETPICCKCLPAVWEQIIIKYMAIQWWEQNQEYEQFKYPKQQVRKPKYQKCLKGMNCPLQDDQDHILLFTHLCGQI